MKKYCHFFLWLLFIFQAAYPQSAITIETNTSITAGENTDVCAASKTVSGDLLGSGTWCNTALPTELVMFTGKAGKSFVHLEWKTATETDNYGFEIHFRSPAVHNNWTVIGFVHGSGTTNTPQSYSFRHNTILHGTLHYRLKQIDADGAFKYSDVVECRSNYQTIASLETNFPNPFNSSTTFHVTVPEDGRAVLSLYNMLGQHIATVFDQHLRAGETRAAHFSNFDLSTGSYIAQLHFGGTVISKKIMQVK
ncbi:MAG: T9SS type A sorting domain-containing protein [Bacteroidota bacterium]